MFRSPQDFALWRARQFGALPIFLSDRQMAEGTAVDEKVSYEDIILPHFLCKRLVCPYEYSKKILKQEMRGINQTLKSVSKITSRHAS